MKIAAGYRQRDTHDGHPRDRAQAVPRAALLALMVTGGQGHALADEVPPPFTPADAITMRADRGRQSLDGARLLVNLSGRGDKDLDQYLRTREAR